MSVQSAVPDLGERDPRAASRTMPSIVIVGMGYVGLPTALSYLDSGRSVAGFDINVDRIARIRDLDVDLFETDRQRLRRYVQADALALTADPSAIEGAGAVLICVPTPIDGHLFPDLGPLRAACDTVVRHATPGMTIVLTSTTYVGCTREFLVDPLSARGLVVGEDLHVAFSPERIDPGVATHRPEVTPRVIGGYSPECTKRAVELLRPSCAALHEVSSLEAAEMTKLLENTFRAVNLALVNEFAEAARTLDVDVAEVVEAAATKPYGFMKFLPGPGVGGHCIPCDPHYLLWQLRRHRIHPQVISAAMNGIAARPATVVQRAREVLADRGVRLRGARVLLVGMAYKPDVADVRESPSVEIATLLVQGGGNVHLVDPLVRSVTVAGQSMIPWAELPDPRGYDLVLVCHLPGCLDPDALSAAPVVLDASYRLPAAANVVVP